MAPFAGSRFPVRELIGQHQHYDPKAIGTPAGGTHRHDRERPEGVRENGAAMDKARPRGPGNLGPLGVHDRTDN